MKLIKLLIIINFMFCLCSCDTNKSKEEKWGEVNYLDLNEIIDEINTKRYDSTSNEEKGLEFLLKYKDIDKTGILSLEEIQLLQKPRELNNGSISKEEAIEDTDLFFRLLKYTYAPYEYFGEENFIQAKDEVVNTIEKKRNYTCF